MIMNMRMLWMMLAAGVVLPASGSAETVRLDLGNLATQTAHEAGRVSPLAMATDGRPLSALLRIPAGGVLAPHGGGETALVTVLSGTLSWGDGDAVDPARERSFAPGSVLVVNGRHWAAARGGEVLLQVVRLAEGNRLSPGVAEQAEGQRR